MARGFRRDQEHEEEPSFPKARLERRELLEAQRLYQRTLFDLEMLREIGYCHGIENYSRHLSGRAPGEPPPTLLDYLPRDVLMIIDESHQSIPQVRGMYHGDRQRKSTLVEYGFRMPSALDNRPLNFEEFEARVGQCLYVSATPGPYELLKTQGVVVEQVIRPTGSWTLASSAPVKGQSTISWPSPHPRECNERVLVPHSQHDAEDLPVIHDLCVRVRTSLGHDTLGGSRSCANLLRASLDASGHQPPARRPRSTRFLFASRRDKEGSSLGSLFIQTMSAGAQRRGMALLRRRAPRIDEAGHAKAGSGRQDAQHETSSRPIDQRTHDVLCGFRSRLRPNPDDDTAAYYAIYRSMDASKGNRPARRKSAWRPRQLGREGADLRDKIRHLRTTEVGLR